MERKVFKTGNSHVISLPKEILQRLNLKDGNIVSIALNDAQTEIIIKPTQPQLNGVDNDFARQVAEFIETYRPALTSLAGK